MENPLLFDFHPPADKFRKIEGEHTVLIVISGLLRQNKRLGTMSGLINMGDERARVKSVKTS